MDTLRAGVPFALAALVLAGCSAPPRERVMPTLSLSGPDVDFLHRYALTNRFRCGKPNSIVLSPDGSKAYFLRSGPRDFKQDLYELDTNTCQERVLVTAAALLAGGSEHLSPEEQARRERARQTAKGITSFELSKDGTRMLVPLSGKLFIIDLAGGMPHELKASIADAPPPLDPQMSPDGKSVAFVRAGDLWVVDIASGKETALTTGATETLTRGDAEFVAQEEMDRRHGFWWSPDSTQIAYQETDVSNVEEVFIMDPLKPYVAPQSWRYPRPGKPNAKVRLGVIPAGGGDTTWIDWDSAKYEYLVSVAWDKGAPLTMVVANRAQTERVVLGVQGSKTQAYITESDPAWLNIDADLPRWLQDGSGFFWGGDLTGASKLELIGVHGQRSRDITPASLGFKHLVWVDPQGREAIVQASADPTQMQLFRVPIGGGEDAAPVLLMGGGPGIHGAVVSDNGATLVHSDSPMRGHPSATIHRRDAAAPSGYGPAVCTIRSMAELPGLEPRLEFTTIGDLDYHAVLVRPRDFKEGRKYPVLVSVYAGPTALTVQKSQDSYVFQQWMADHGFIVVSIDNRGTDGRGRDWERCIKGDLITKQLEDQVAGVRALGRKYAELDMTRVGIYGWSFGGYFSVMAALQRPDVYKAACAGAPVVDWTDYDTTYTERYLQTPTDNPRGYEVSSCLTYAGSLKVPLLIIHGTADDNVYFTNSLKLTDALLRKGQSFEFLPLAGFTHIVADPDVVEKLYTRMAQFFVEKLR